MEITRFLSWGPVVRGRRTMPGGPLLPFAAQSLRHYGAEDWEAVNSLSAQEP